MKEQPTDTIWSGKLRISVRLLPFIANGSCICHRLLHEGKLKSNLTSRFSAFALQFDPCRLIVELGWSHSVTIIFFEHSLFYSIIFLEEETGSLAIPFLDFAAAAKSARGSGLVVQNGRANAASKPPVKIFHGADLHLADLVHAGLLIEVQLQLCLGVVDLLQQLLLVPQLLLNRDFT